MIGNLRLLIRAAFKSAHALTATIAGALLLAAAPAAAQRLSPEDHARVAGEMAAAANALIEAAGAPGVAAGILGMPPVEALTAAMDSAERQDWSYWPRVRTGLPLGQMTAAQRILAHDLLGTLMSSRGYLQATHVMGLEEVLAAVDATGFPRGQEMYHVTIFGEPGGAAPWAWRFEGHHLSLNVTVTGDSIHVTPHFVGANPITIPSGMRAGFEVQRYERQTAFNLLRALDPAQRERAVIAGRAPFEVLSGTLNLPPERRDAWQSEIGDQGVAATEMTADQRALLADLADHVFSRFRPEIAASYRQATDIDSLRFVWMGPQEEGAPYYFRVAGGDFVYEYTAAQENGAHAHTIWRSRTNDLGEAALTAR